MIRLIFMLVFLLHLGLWCGRAADNVSILQEISQTETVYLREKGEIQVTASWSMSAGEKEDVLTIPLAIEYGFTDVWQVEFEWDTFILKDPDNEPSADGIGDLTLGTKYSFQNVGGSNFHIAPAFQIEFPLSSIDKGLTEGFIKYEPSVVLALDVPGWHFLQIFTEAGVELLDRSKESGDPEDRDPRAHEFRWDSGFLIPIREAVITFEFNWETNEWNNGGQNSEMYLTPGLDWEIFDDWEINIEIQVGLNNDADAYNIIGTLTYELDFWGD